MTPWNHPIRTVLAVTAMLTACAASPALARPQPYPGTAASSPAQAGTNLCSEVCSGGAASLSERADRTPADPGARFPQHPRVPLNSASSGVPTTTPPAVAKAPAHTNRFDWGDAAIGAAGAILLTLAVGGGLATMTRRSRRLRQSSASATG